MSKYFNPVQQSSETTQEKSYPQYLLTEPDTPAQSVHQSEGVDDKLGPADVHYLVVDQEHLVPLSLGVSALRMAVDRGIVKYTIILY